MDFALNFAVKFTFLFFQYQAHILAHILAVVVVCCSDALCLLESVETKFPHMEKVGK